MARLEWIFHCWAMQHSLSAGSNSLYALFYSYMYLFQLMRYKLAVACQWSFLPSVLASLLWLLPINTRRSFWKLLWLLVLTILLRSVITLCLSKDLTSWFIGDIDLMLLIIKIHPLPLHLLRNHKQGNLGYNCHWENYTNTGKDSVILFIFHMHLEGL